MIEPMERVEEGDCDVCHRPTASCHCPECQTCGMQGCPGCPAPVSPGEPLIIRLVTNVSRIAGLAAGCADAMALCKASSNIEGVIRVFREIQQLAEEIVPAAPEASKTPAEASEAEQSPPEGTP